MIKKVIKFFLNLPLPFLLPYKFFCRFFFLKKNNKKDKIKILFSLKNLGLGDCILMRPAIVFLMNKVAADYYFYHQNSIGKDWLSFFFCGKIKSVTKWQQIKNNFFFKIYDLSLNENPFAVKLRLLSTKKLIGIGFGYKKFLYDIYRSPLKKIHAADYWFYLINGEKKITKNLFYLENFIFSKENLKPNFKKNKIVMVPFAGVKNNKIVSEEKCWKIINYLKLAEKIYLCSKIKVTFIGTSAEEKLFQKLIKKFKINPTIIDNQIGKLNLKEIFYLLQKTKLVICNNSGILHFSVAMRAASISFINGVDITMWKNYTDNEIHQLFYFHEKEKIEKAVFEKLY